MGRVHQPSRVATSSHRSLPVRWWWLALLGLLVVIAVVVNRPAGAPPLAAPTAVTAAQLAATPDLHLIYTATNDLRWRLLLAPESVLDYVVWHEACHLKVPDHSRRFWSLVERHCPDWRDHARWLSRYGSALVL